MHILVTGGMGAVGRPTVQWLLDRGHTVRVLDLKVSRPIDGAECLEGDITDFASLGPMMAGIDGVIHLAAIPDPDLGPEHTIFEVNVGGTFNIYRAAADAGIGRMVCASSINALGYNYGIKFPEHQLRYFPIDEAHPTYTTDPYSFSKRAIEDIGAYFYRREGITSVFLRYPAVYDTQSEDGAMLLQFLIESGEQTAAVMALPEPERSRRVAGIIAAFEARAAAREWETGPNWDLEDSDVMFGRSNFWTSLDVRDAAQAAEKGLLADLKGSHALYVSNADNFVGIPSRDLAAVWFTAVAEWRAPVKGTETLVSIDAARALIGFEPAYPLRRTP